MAFVISAIYFLIKKFFVTTFNVKTLKLNGIFFQKLERQGIFFLLPLFDTLALDQHMLFFQNVLMDFHI